MMRICTIFAFSSTGFGHLRVVRALQQSMPKIYGQPYYLGEHDDLAEYMHKITSSGLGTIALKFTQYGIGEELYTYFYTQFLQSTAAEIFLQLETIVDQQVVKPAAIVIVAAHFGLAHKISAIKADFFKKIGIRIILVVQVTDATSQLLWYVPKADIMLVPSYKVLNDFKQYERQNSIKPVRMFVNAYPVSNLLAQTMPLSQYKERFYALKPASKHYAIIAIPISGASVGLRYLSSLIKLLQKLSPYYKYRIVIKESGATKGFITNLQADTLVSIDKHEKSSEVVALYDRLYEKHIIALEITKPSEQAFKCLLSTDSRGGCILLFTNPVGRQEEDNIYFLQTHHLIPSNAEHELLLRYAFLNKEPTTDILEKAKYWRGICLPSDPLEAGRFIAYLHEKGVFLHMLYSKRHTYTKEINPHGTLTFWEQVSSLLL
jgi:hypothetical protein